MRFRDFLVLIALLAVVSFTIWASFVDAENTQYQPPTVDWSGAHE